jgi:membrane protein DedA with SNARE-associated domain
VTIARFIEGLRQANGISAGITGMHWAKFLAFNALGAALWVTVCTSVGYLSGNHIHPIYNTAKQYELYFAIAVSACSSHTSPDGPTARENNEPPPPADEPA